MFVFILWSYILNTIIFSVVNYFSSKQNLASQKSENCKLSVMPEI